MMNNTTDPDAQPAQCPEGTPPPPPAQSRCFHCPECKAQIQAGTMGQLQGIRDKKRHRRRVQMGLEKSWQTEGAPDDGRANFARGNWNDALYRNPDGTVNDLGLKYAHAYNHRLDYHWDEINPQQEANRDFRRKMTPEQAKQFQMMAQWEALPDDEKMVTEKPTIPNLPNINIRASGTHPITGGNMGANTAGIAAPTDEELKPYIKPFLDRVARFDDPSEENEKWLGNFIEQKDPTKPQMSAVDFAKDYYGNRMEGLLGNYLDTGVTAESARGNSHDLAKRLGIDNLQAPSQIASQSLPRFHAAMKGGVLTEADLKQLEDKVKKIGENNTYNDGGWVNRSLGEIAQARQQGAAHYAGMDFNHGLVQRDKVDPLTGSVVRDAKGHKVKEMAPKSLHRYAINKIEAHQGMNIFQKNYGDNVDDFFRRHNSQADLAFSLEGLPGMSRKLSTLAAYNYGRGITAYPRPGTDDEERKKRWTFDGDTPHDLHYNKYMGRLGMQEGMGHDNSMLAHRALGNLISRIARGDFGQEAIQQHLGNHYYSILKHGFQSGKTAQGTFTSKEDCPTNKPNCKACEMRNHCKTNAQGLDPTPINYTEFKGNSKEDAAKYGINVGGTTDNSRTGALIGYASTGQMPSASVKNFGNLNPEGVHADPVRLARYRADLAEKAAKKKAATGPKIPKQKKAKVGSHMPDPMSPEVPSSDLAMSLRSYERGGLLSALFKAKSNGGDLPKWMGRTENGAFPGSAKAGGIKPPQPPQPSQPPQPQAGPPAPAPLSSTRGKSPSAGISPNQMSMVSNAFNQKQHGETDEPPTVKLPPRKPTQPAIVNNAQQTQKIASPSSANQVSPATPSVTSPAASPLASALRGAKPANPFMGVGSPAMSAQTPNPLRTGGLPGHSPVNALSARLHAAKGNLPQPPQVGGPAKMGMTQPPADYTPAPSAPSLAGRLADYAPKSTVKPPTPDATPAINNPRAPSGPQLTGAAQGAAMNPRNGLSLPSLSGGGPGKPPGPPSPSGSPAAPVPPPPSRYKGASLGQKLRSFFAPARQWEGGNAPQAGGHTVELNDWQQDALRNNQFNLRPGGITDRVKGERWKTDINTSQPAQRPEPNARVQLSPNMRAVLSDHELQRKQVSPLTSFVRRFKEGAQGYNTGALGNYSYRMAPRRAPVNPVSPQPTQQRNAAGLYQDLPPVYIPKNPITGHKNSGHSSGGRVGSSRLPLAYRQFNKR